MGMFDSVYGSCPHCDKKIEFQSKAGDCGLASYTLNSCPANIAMDLDGERKPCPRCGKILVFKCRTIAQSWLECN